MKSKLTLKIILILIGSDVLETFTHFCFKKSVIAETNFNISSLSDAVTFALAALSSGYLWVGLASVLLTFIVWSTVLSKIDLSIAVPIASSSYIMVAVVSILFLHEKISALRWLGIFVILLGVICVSLSSKDKETALS
jgi:drug/metabolite transporter (DMT)-like permease